MRKRLFYILIDWPNFLHEENEKLLASYVKQFLLYNYNFNL